MYHQQMRIADKLADEFIQDIKEMGCFDQEMILYVGRRILDFGIKT